MIENKAIAILFLSSPCLLQTMFYYSLVDGQTTPPFLHRPVTLAMLKIALRTKSTLVLYSIGFSRAPLQYRTVTYHTFTRRFQCWIRQTNRKRDSVMAKTELLAHNRRTYLLDITKRQKTKNQKPKTKQKLEGKNPKL